jgi:aspartyl-tRNA(Asn)/glutamyl-tRNA(Gln) amidotransferase subunit C
MALTLEQVRHVAELARLALTPEEERRFVHQLSAILEAMETLREVDTTGVPPTSHASDPGALREDDVQPSLPTEAALVNAPARAGTSFAVPKIIE